MGDLQPMIDHVVRTGILMVRGIDGVSYGKDFRGRHFRVPHIPLKKDGTPHAGRRSHIVMVPSIIVAGVTMTVQTWDEVRPMFQRALDALAIPFDDANGVHGITSTVRCAVEPVHVVMKTFVVRGDFGHEATCQEGEEYRFFNIHKPLSPGTIAWSSCYGNHQIGPMTWVEFCNRRNLFTTRQDLVLIDDNYGTTNCPSIRWARKDPNIPPTVLRTIQAS